MRSDLPTQDKSICHESEKKVEGKLFPKDVEVTKNDVSLLAPITPDPNREVRDLSNNSKSPPTLVSSSPPQTPLKGVFDPFAPGPEKLLHAPYSRKFRSNSQGIAIRRLDFDHCEADVKATVTLDDEILLETVYDTLLEVIISKQIEEGVLDVCTDLEDGCKTPESSKRLTGIAETCPEAPVKCGRKSRNIDKSLCRKLEF